MQNIEPGKASKPEEPKEVVMEVRAKERQEATSDHARHERVM